MFKRVNKRACASLLPLVLTPQIHFSKSRPTISSELAEVIELQNTAGAEYLQPFLRKRLMAVGEIMNGVHRAVSEARRGRRRGAGGGRRGRAPARGGGRRLD